MKNYRINDRIFLKKYKYFLKFIEERPRVNIILGSSLVEDALIPDSLGSNWFSFTNRYQSIYESFKFLDYYKDKIIIDTVVIALQPFDFPKSYEKHYINDGRSINGSFYVFGEDSITSLALRNNTDPIKKTIQLIIDQNFINFEKIIQKLTNSVLQPPEDVWTTQGYSGRINASPVNLDKLYLKFLEGEKMKGSTFNRHSRYFANVTYPPNLIYFDLFNKKVNEMETKAIYLLTPKSKYYFSALKNNGYDNIWNKILDKLASNNVDLWDFERMVTDTFDFNFFWDETHVTNQGATEFTELIKKRFSD